MVSRDGACRPLRELAHRLFPFEFVSFLIGQRPTSPAGEAVAGPHQWPAVPPHPGVGTRRRERSGRLRSARRLPPLSRALSSELSDDLNEKLVVVAYLVRTETFRDGFSFCAF